MSINEIISAYLKAKEAETQAKKEKENLAAMIKEFSHGKEFFETDNFMVTLKKSVQNRLDTKQLEKDFPDIKKEYCKPVETCTINAIAKSKAENAA